MTQQQGKIAINKDNGDGRGGQAAPSMRDASNAFEALRRDIDDVFDRFTRGLPRWPSFSSNLFDWEPFRDFGAFRGFGRLQPRADVVETGAGYEISVELPGIDEKDVTLTLRDNALTLRGEKKSEREESGAGVHVSERTYGSFRRTFRVPEDVDPDKVEAAFDNGVLKVTLPKSAKAKGEEREIGIKTK